MVRYALLLAAMAAVLGIAWPLGSAAFGGGGNEATRLVEAANRTQQKGESLKLSYNDLIPPDVSPFASLAGSGGSPSGDSGGPSDSGGSPSSGDSGGSPSGNGGAEEDPKPTIPFTPTPAEHAVQDAIELLQRAQQAQNPDSSEYLQAVNQLKAAWGPRYAKAVDEFRRFKHRVDHAEEMSTEYLEIQARLTDNISDQQVRERLREVDALERELIAEWIAQANDVITQAEVIKVNLDDMTIRITKLELSATFSLIYEGFQEMPLALTALNDELGRFERETERIYQVFGPKAQQ
jgi:hypothetical protein